MSGLQKLDEITQRPDETIAYTVDVSNVGSSPTVNDVTAYEKQTDATWSDVSETVLSGSASVADNVITTPQVTSLTDGKLYHIEINYTISGNVFEDYLVIVCTDDR